MAKRLKYGIQWNMGHRSLYLGGVHVGISRLMDLRTTAEVEASRDPTNRKPYRNKFLKGRAKQEAKKIREGKNKGTYRAQGVGVLYHPEMVDHKGNLKGTAANG